MKGPYRLRSILSSAWFLAIIPAIALMIFAPPIGSRYFINIEEAEDISTRFYYSDLNGDTTSEILEVNKGSLPFYYVNLKNIDGRIYDQWNISDSMDSRISELFFGDYDNDRFGEIYVFSHKRDSLFLNINEMLDQAGTRKERLFVTQTGFFNGQLTSALYPAGFWDKNNDGFAEFYFTITSAFRTGPRRLYCFDIKNEKLYSSVKSAITLLDPEMKDTDNDHTPEIFGILSASGNYMADEQYSDSSTWFMVFNDQLEFEFPPVEYPGFANGLSIKSFNGSYVLLHWAGGADTTVMPSRVMIYSTKGQLLRSRDMSELNHNQNSFLFVFPHDENDRLILAGDRISEINGLLEVVRSIKNPFESHFASYMYDLDHNGTSELILYSQPENRFVVYNEDLDLLAENVFRAPTAYLSFSDRFDEHFNHQTYINSEGKGFFLDLEKNRYYSLVYLENPAIYLFFVLFMSLARKLNTLQIVRREQLKQRLITLQLMGIKSQLDPHFTFNTLNSVASLIYLSDRETAYDYLTKFTSLLRTMLNDAERIYRSLSEEIDFVKTYLELEKLRFRDKFDYEIITGEGLTLREEVPKLVLHTFAENAIKHGIMPRADGGLLRITIVKEESDIKISVEDNGIGREKSAGQSKSTGKGLRLTTEFYEILNEINKKPIRHLITDLSDEHGNPCGTRVEVWVPLNQSQ